MQRALSFTLILLCGLGLLAWGGYTALATTTRSWFERDLTLRASLAVESARSSLSSALRSGDQTELATVLGSITRNERIMGAALCAPQLSTTTAGFPQDVTCHRLIERERAERGSEVDSFELEQAAGKVRISLHALTGGAFVALAHDLAFMVRRERTTRDHVLAGFAVLAVAASLLSMLAARIAWRTWLKELRESLEGPPARQFEPLVLYVRELAHRLASEREEEHRTGRWTAERLRAALTEHLQGERVVLLANREPYIHQRDEAGEIKVVHPASGLVTALEPVMRACSGVWVGHGSGSADREMVDSLDRVRVPPEERSYWLRRVWLSGEEEAGYYYGFSNEGLWPLCHVAHARPTFRAKDFAQYKRVNQRFADAVCEEVDIDDPIILVQDYHFALAPRMIRARLPRATILTFWHIPWPNAERFGICPWQGEILEGLLGSSILGFHTQQHCNNFLEAADSFLEARVDREHRAVAQRGRTTLVRSYPISIEWPVQSLAKVASASDCRGEVLRELSLPRHALLGVGVDRLDYTKGIEERLMAVDTLLASYPEYRNRFVFVQLAAPSRTQIELYRELNLRVERLVEEINGRWAQGSYRPIVLHCAHHESSSVYRYYRAADLCYVSSLHDGMNLVAKEFVAARDDERGVLVLSQFTGAARELTEALIVNPYDVQQASDAMAAALRMTPTEQSERMRSMRRIVSELNVYRWAGRMLIDAAELRRRERLTGRLRVEGTGAWQLRSLGHASKDGLGGALRWGRTFPARGGDS